MDGRFIAAIKYLCDEALEGNIKIKQFYRLWPDNANSDVFVKQVYQDVEDLIQHTPGSLFTGKIDHKKLHNSQIYLTVYLDRIILDYSGVSSQLKQCRDIVLSQQNLNRDSIEHGVKMYLSGNRGQSLNSE